VNSVPFWWLVRRVVDGKAGYYDAANTAWFAHQAWGEPFLSREDAEETAKSTGEPSARVVRVHARIPEPKLPAWVKPVILGDERYLVGVRRVYPSEVTEYTFHVADSGALAAVDLWQHTPDGKRFCGGFTAAPPNVWAEAAQRAAKMLRARKAAR
jgi:hypothetical protein